MTTDIKIIKAILFFFCLLDMPYGFFQFVRFFIMLDFPLLAYLNSEMGNKTEMIIYIGLAIPFQPLFKVLLGMRLWNIVDMFVGIG